MESWAWQHNVTQKSLASIAAARDVLEVSRLQIESSRALIKRTRERLQQREAGTRASPIVRLIWVNKSLAKK